MKSTLDISALESAVSPSEEERRALAERIVASSQFRRSARLRDFLLYVVLKSLRDPHAELNEQEIGEKVFGRSAFYDRSQDNIVRVNATELRRRIDLYFAGEGAEESLVLEIPRGGYKPVYHWRVVEPPVLPEPALPEVVAVEPVAAPLLPPKIDEPVRRGTPWLYKVWVVATVLLVAFCGVLLRSRLTGHEGAGPATSKPVLMAFWNSFTSGQQQTDIVLADDSVSLIEDITHHPVTLQEYLNREYMRQIQASALSADRKMDLDQVFSHNLVTFGTVRAGQMVMAQMPSTPTPHMTVSRFYTADAMKRDNVVLVGGSKANPWVTMFDDRMNFAVEYDYVQGHGLIANRHPNPGEQATYTAPIYPNTLTGYSVVAYVPKPGRTGDAIILAGMDSDSTSAAAEFLTSESQLESLQRMMKVKEFPYFEVLLRISRISGTSFGAEVVAYRMYPKAD